MLPGNIAQNLEGQRIPVGCLRQSETLGFGIAENTLVGAGHGPDIQRGQDEPRCPVQEGQIPDVPECLHFLKKRCGQKENRPAIRDKNLKGTDKGAHLRGICDLINGHQDV